MTEPQQGSPTDDRELEALDALASLDDLEVTRVADTLPRDNPLMSVDPTSVMTAAPAPLGEAVPAQTTVVRDEKTILRRKRTRRRVRNDDGRSLLRKPRQAQTQRPAVPSLPYDDDAVPVAKAPETGVRAGAVGVVLLVVIMALRLAAIALCGLVVVAAIPGLGYRVSLMPLLDYVTTLLPAQVAGLMVIPTPFGGAWRGDLVLAALTLYVAEWLLTRLRFGMARS